jgi:hypothetical protein
MRIRPALLAALVALPLAATAGTATLDLEPASIAAGPEHTLLDGSTPSAPPACAIVETDEATGETTVGCCWVFHMGRWWCVPC